MQEKLTLARAHLVSNFEYSTLLLKNQYYYLSKIPFLLNSNSYNFDTEIIIQLKLANMRIKEIPIPTFYGKEVSYLNGTVYAVNVILDSLIGSMHKLGLLYQKKFDVKKIKKK